MTSTPLGLIAGGGDLPDWLARHVRSTGRDVFVLALRGFASSSLLKDHTGAQAAMGEVGRAIRLLQEAGCEELVFAGAVTKPDLSALRMDLQGMALVPQLAAAAAKGDDALLRVVVGAFEKAGFKVIGADDVLSGLLAQAGALGRLTPRPEDWLDIRLAASAALDLGAADIGQGAVARSGTIIAREAQDGTDAMLSRIPLFSPPSGVLVKRPKPQQERRIDLPTIGLRTVEGAAAAGLAGIVVEAGAALVVDRDAVRRAADEAGVFVYGFNPAELA